MLADPKNGEHFKILYEISKEQCIDSPLVKSSSQMSSFSKLLKECISNERELDDVEIKTLTEELNVKASSEFLDAKIS